MAGTAYLVMLGVFAAMPLLVARRCDEERTRNSVLLDQFIARSDVVTRHQITIHAPAGMVLEIARDFDMQSIFVVRAIFWLRGRVLGAKIETARRPAGLITEMLHLGWTRLAEEPNRFFVAGAACQPWQANVTFSPISPEQFAAFAERDRVKIAWSLEAEALGPALTRFTTETRAVATDHGARKVSAILAYLRDWSLNYTQAPPSHPAPPRRASLEGCSCFAQGGTVEPRSLVTKSSVLSAGAKLCTALSDLISPCIGKRALLRCRTAGAEGPARLFQATDTANEPEVESCTGRYRSSGKRPSSRRASFDSGAHHAGDCQFRM